MDNFMARRTKAKVHHHPPHATQTAILKHEITKLQINEKKKMKGEGRRRRRRRRRRNAHHTLSGTSFSLCRI
jgi:hypothetical protein